MEVQNYSRTQLRPNARSTEKTILINPTKRHYSQSHTLLEAGASMNDESILFAPAGAHYELDTQYHLLAPGAEAQSLSRMVSAGGDIVNRALLVGESAGTQGYLGCDGLKLTNDGEILSIPGLLAKDADAQLSHEASIGKISAEKIAYLMATGMDEESARSLLIQGFLNLKQQPMPDAVRDAVHTMIDTAKSGAM